MIDPENGISIGNSSGSRRTWALHPGSQGETLEYEPVPVDDARRGQLLAGCRCDDDVHIYASEINILYLFGIDAVYVPNDG